MTLSTARPVIVLMVDIGTTHFLFVNCVDAAAGSHDASVTKVPSAFLNSTAYEFTAEPCVTAAAVHVIAT